MPASSEVTQSAHARSRPDGLSIRHREANVSPSWTRSASLARVTRPQMPQWRGSRGRGGGPSLHLVCWSLLNRAPGALNRGLDEGVEQRRRAFRARLELRVVLGGHEE